MTTTMSNVEIRQRIIQLLSELLDRFPLESDERVEIEAMIGRHALKLMQLEK
jgi:hypothetical protein